MTRFLGALIVAGVLAAALNDLGYGNGRLFGAQAPLTDVERLTQENLALKAEVIRWRADSARWQQVYGTCAGKLGAFEDANDTALLRQEQAAFKTRIEAARPGYTWDGTGFVKTPDP